MADNTFGISKQTVHDGDFSQKNVNGEVKLSL